MVDHAQLRDDVYVMLLREPSGCLTFQQFVDQLRAHPGWKNVNPLDVRSTLVELLHEPEPRIEWRQDGHYCRHPNQGSRP